MTTLLMTHQGALRCNFSDVLEIPTPQATASWEPVSHGDLLVQLRKQIVAEGYDIVGERYALTPDGNRLFGVICLGGLDGEHAYALGIRNSHDKSYALGLIHGVNVFVCDNLAFKATNAYAVKHTTKRTGSGRYAAVIEQAVSDIAVRGPQSVRWLNMLKRWELSPAEAKAIVCDAYLADVIPSSTIGPILQEYLYPTHEEWVPGNAHSLLMAFTQVFKTMGEIGRIDKAYTRLPEVFVQAHV